jgi:ADP-ribose pyrophosphatase YjhB (NUDIX family)
VTQHGIELFNPDVGKPLVGAHVVMTDGKRVLLTREGKKDWSLPGGKPDKGETPECTAQREFFEETNTHVGPFKSMTVSECFHAKSYVYGAECLPTTAAWGADTRYFDLLSLPRDIMPYTVRHLMAFFGTNDVAFRSHLAALGNYLGYMSDRRGIALRQRPLCLDGPIFLRGTWYYWSRLSPQAARSVMMMLSSADSDV